MCAFYLSDVSRGREPNHRLAFGGCLQTLALCTVFVFAVTTRRLGSISQNCPMPSSPVNVTICPSTSIRYCERVRPKGQEPNRRLAVGGCLQTLAFFHATHFLSLRAEIRGPRGILCTRGEKEHTSKRVSIIACNNVISKTKCATHRPERTPPIDADR